MFFILLLFIPAGLNGQFYEYGQDAGSLRWYQFRSPNYTFIHPEGVDSLARAFARKLEYYHPYQGKALDHQLSPMPVVIHNESSFSNGVFVWAPKRLEIFTNPDPNGYYQDWLTQLALHEGRHAVQIDKLNQGFTRGLYFLGGEQAVGAMAVFLPYWYLEGDAVDAETRLSASGRGRQPSFEMEIKAQLLETGRRWSFSKASLGSYKDHVPNHYQLGYLMVRHGRRTYGDKFWIDFQQYAARKPFLLNPTWFSMRKYGLSSKRQFYMESLDAYRGHWLSTAADRQYTPLKEWKVKPGRSYTSYTFPHISGSGLLSLKSGPDQIPEFVLIDPAGKEKRLFRPGFLNSGRISYAGDRIIWDEFVPDTRWSNRNYSLIRTYDLSTGRVKQLGKRTRYFSPAISGDGTRLAAVEQTDNQEFNLIILDIEGRYKRVIPSPGNRFIQQPCWMDQDSAIVVLVSVETGKSIYTYTLRTGEWKRLFDAGVDDISYPVVKGMQIFFSGTFSGLDNIYCYHTGVQEAFQLTSARFGAFQPQLSADGSTLYYSNYTAGGYSTGILELEEALWKPLELVRDHREQVDYAQTPEEQMIDSLSNNGPDLDFETRRYRKALHLFNFHSWLPAYFDYLDPELSLSPEELPLSLGFSLISQNRLSTAVSQLAYEYRDGFHMFHSGIKFNGRYPVVNLYFDYGGEPDVILWAEGDSVLTLPQDIGFTAQTYVPLRLNTGKFLTLVQPGIDYYFKRDVQYIEEREVYQVGAHYLYYRLYATSYLRKGMKDILPRLGSSISGGYYHAPGSRVFGALAYGGLNFYVPGPLKHQSFRLAAYYQKQFPLDMSHPAFINLINMPRGLNQNIFGEILSRFSADYVFPLLYPDLAIGPLLYLKRIRADIWADYLMGTNVIVNDPDPHYEDRDYMTCGLDLMADMNIFRIPFPLSAGGRISYEPETGNISVQGIFSIDID